MLRQNELLSVQLHLHQFTDALIFLDFTHNSLEGVAQPPAVAVAWAVLAEELIEAINNYDNNSKSTPSPRQQGKQS
eukprot:scaffold236_cov164-Ochromonas_danica.AAC.2